MTKLNLNDEKLKEWMDDSVEKNKFLPLVSLTTSDKPGSYIGNSSKEIISFLLKHKDFICNETQALELYIDNNVDDSKLMDIDIASLKVESTVINYKIKKIT